MNTKEMNTQPEALRLADEIDADPMLIGYSQAAAELRRLHEVNQELLEVLKELTDNPYRDGTAGYLQLVSKARYAIAKATGESK